jgi:hypothetical protein
LPFHSICTSSWSAASINCFKVMCVGCAFTMHACYFYCRVIGQIAFKTLLQFLIFSMGSDRSSPTNSTSPSSLQPSSPPAVGEAGFGCRGRARLQARAWVISPPQLFGKYSINWGQRCKV